MGFFDDLPQGGLPQYDDDLGPEAAGVERDRWGRPIIDGVAYTRASTLGGLLSDARGIHTWERRLLIHGLGRSLGLWEEASGLPDIWDVSTDKALLTPEQREEDKATKAHLDSIGERAMEIGGRHVKANYGTAFHAHTDPHDGSEKALSPRMAADVASFVEATDWLEQVRSEPFLVNRDLRCAGSADGFWKVPGLGTVVGDKKTGQFKPLDHIVQLAVYAGATFHDDGSSPADHWGDYTPDWGLIFHTPAHHARTEVYLIDLVAGLEDARLAALVRDRRERRKKADIARLVTRGEVVGEAVDDLQVEPPAPVDALFTLLSDAPTRYLVQRIVAEHREREGSGWTDEHTEYATARWKALPA